MQPQRVFAIERDSPFFPKDSHAFFVRPAMVIVFNPTAGRRRMEVLCQLIDLLSANGIRFQVFETRRPGDAEGRARQAVRDGSGMVVAAGGDGTIAEVANGLIGSSVSLGVVPLGTANVLAHELSLPFAPRDIAKALAFGRTRPLWPGLVTGPDGPRVFMQMLGAGFDAQVVHHLPRGLKRILGRTAYALQTVRELSRYEHKRIRVRLDGQEAEAAGVIVSKGRLYAGEYVLAPAARPGEPGFSVVLFDLGGIGATVRYGAALLAGMLSRAPGVTHIRAGRIDFLGNQRVPVQTDGDGGGFTPLSIRDAPAPIQVVVTA